MTQNVTAGKKNWVGIITMFFLFAMISFVTNMAAPFGNIWGIKYEWSGMLGNLMNFAAYLFMGIPAGKMLASKGYKKTALWAIVLGFAGLMIQYLSSKFGAETIVMNAGGQPVTLNLFIYLLGAFVCGFCVCMLNTVVNPMLNLLGGGGKSGNQLLQAGGSLNSLAGSLTPMLVGALIGTVTQNTVMADVAPLLFIGMGVFALSYIIILCVKIPEPGLERQKAEAAAGIKKEKASHSAWSFRHFVLGALGIFFYVGIEIGIPAEMNFYISDATEKGAGILINGAAIGGAIVMCYWLLMLVGRVSSSAISGKVSTATQLMSVSGVAIVFVLIAYFLPKENTFSVPKFVYNPSAKTEAILTDVGLPTSAIEEFKNDPQGFDWAKYPTVKIQVLDEATETLVEKEVNPADRLMSEFEIEVADAPKMMETPQVPLSCLFLVLCGLCTSLMWGGIFNLAVEGLGKYTEQASGIFMMLVVGGGIMPLIQHNWLSASFGYMFSYWLIVAMLAYLFYYAVAGCKNVNKDIPVE